jgi:inhibitor of cysteine peptidase
VKIRLLVAVAVLVSSTVLGCHFESRDAPSTKTLQVPMKEVLKQSVITQNITLAVGNTLLVKLGSNYSTPYRWTADTKIGDSSILKQTAHEFVHPATDALGAPGTQVWTFAALKPGTTTISTAYASFVGKETKPVCTYTANVTVQ